VTYHLSVYLEDDLHAALQDFAAKRGKSLSIVAVAAIASFLSPDAAERQEAVMTRRLDRLGRQFERIERDLGISVEMLALFVRFWLAATPAVPETAQAAARAKGQERYERFVEALGRRLAAGKLFTREVSLDVSDENLSGHSFQDAV
jgi:hypothetical protein